MPSSYLQTPNRRTVSTPVNSLKPQRLARDRTYTGHTRPPCSRRRRGASHLQQQEPTHHIRENETCTKHVKNFARERGESAPHLAPWSGWWRRSPPSRRPPCWARLRGQGNDQRRSTEHGERSAGRRNRGRGGGVPADEEVEKRRGEVGNEGVRGEGVAGEMKDERRAAGLGFTAWMGRRWRGWGLGAAARGRRRGRRQSRRAMLRLTWVKTICLV